MSRHKRRSERIASKLHFLDNYVVASTRDLRARRKMKHLGFIIDFSASAKPPIPTRRELTEELEAQGYRGITLTEIKRHSYAGARLNPHQNVAVYYESKQEVSRKVEEDSRNVGLLNPRRYIFPAYASAAGC
ncbi:MAG TPA: hypothetical protein VHA12_00330 [Candidatus Nanoarchaeia archaeon]|nr:hypothetical protein [Candidatus Nanoarchaeia archaeon]